jgi:diguanylate cyclase (GGDEF)-like protein/PAS domain S-box-containing protein
MSSAPERDERVIAAFDDAPIATSLVSTEGQILRVNRAYCELLGRSQADLLGAHFATIVHPEHLAESLEALGRFASGKARAWHAECRVLHADGHAVWTLVAVSMVPSEPGYPPYFIVQFQDISGRKLAEEQWRTRAAEQAAVADLGHRALAGGDLSRLMQDAVETVCSTLGADRAVVMELLPGGEELMLRAAVGAQDGVVGHFTVALGDSQSGLAVRTREPVLVQDWASETRFARVTTSRYLGASGIAVPILGREQTFGVLSVQSETPQAFSPDDIAFLEAMAHVVAEAVHRVRAEDETRHRALHDPLTGLPNRVLFRDRLEHALAQGARRPSTVAVLFLDLDNFKSVNDTLGHGAGDELLRALTPRLQSVLRPADTLARLGGDEFAVLCEDLTEAGAVTVAERLAAVLREPIPAGGGEHHITASVGIAVADSSAADPDGLLRDADAAMYRAKERGRARYELFDERLREQTVERLHIENGLRGAVQRGELRLVYQPLVSLEDGSLRGLEALLRWETPDRGLVMPDDFIPAAEQSGLIVPIGAWVLQEACRQAERWRRARSGDPLRVSVNVSAVQLAQPDFARVVERALLEAGATPELLCLELTETVLMEAGDAAVDVLHELRALGVQVVLDDFGTGYSALNYLEHIPLDGLKVDRTFAAGLAENGPHSSAIYGAVVAMASALSLPVVAEGVETAEQVSRLQALGCDVAQGFYFARPVPPEEIDALVAADERSSHG